MREFYRRYLRVRVSEHGVLCVGTQVWAFTRTRCDDADGPYDWDNVQVYRTFVLHVGRLHITLEWAL